MQAEDALKNLYVNSARLDPKKGIIVFELMKMGGRPLDDNIVVSSECAVPTITHITDPTPPGKLCVIVGDGWRDHAPEARVRRIADDFAREPHTSSLPESGDVPMRITVHSPQVLIAELPSGEFGVFSIQLKVGVEWSEPYLINRAQAEWLSTDLAAPGDIIRVFGRNLVSLSLYEDSTKEHFPVSYGGYVAGNTRVVLSTTDGDGLECPIVKMSAYDVHFRIPLDIKPDKYLVRVHNGHGGSSGWSQPLEVNIAPKKQWPQEVFDVMDFGAVANGCTNDTPSVVGALNAAEENGGGIVYFPPGSYLVTATLHIPRYTILRGESRERSWIFFPDGTDHGTRDQGMRVPVGVQGESDFGVENLSIHGVYGNLLVAAPVKDLLPESKTARTLFRDMLILEGPGANNVFIHNCRIYQEPTYRYQYRADDPFLNEERLGNTGPNKFGNFAAVALRGEHIMITDSAIKGGGIPILLIGQYVYVTRNELFAGSNNGGFSIYGGNYPTTRVPEFCIFEDNTITPASNQNHGPVGVHATGSHFYFARNYVRPFWVCDSEGFCFHGTGTQAILSVVESQGATVRYAVEDVHAWFDRNLKPDWGATPVDEFGICDKERNFLPGKLKKYECVIVQGRGLGQKRIVINNTSDTLTLDKPWELPPEKGSLIAVTSYPQFHKIILVDNVIEDAGSGIMACFGNGFDLIIDGNVMRRAGGVQILQVNGSYREWSGNFFVQVLHNTVSEGRFYGGILTSWTAGISGTIGVCKPTRGIGNLGIIFRGNRHENDSAIWLRAGQLPLDSAPVDVGVVVEDNLFARSKVGIEIGCGVDVVVRNNQFEHVTEKIRDWKEVISEK